MANNNNTNNVNTNIKPINSKEVDLYYKAFKELRKYVQKYPIFEEAEYKPMFEKVVKVLNSYMYRSI